LSVSFRAMAQSENHRPTAASLAIDAVLVLAFFAVLYRLVSPHVPSNDPKMILLWGGLCSACMSGVFWICLQMFRVVLRAQREAGRK
jgi:hypothetical protein